MDTIKYIMFVIIFIIICVIIKRINNKYTRRSINNFEGEFQNSETNTYISETIDRLMNSKFNNLRIVKSNSKSDSNENINILENDTPLGHITYFINNPSSDHWLPCDGREIFKEDYPDFFNLKVLKGRAKAHLPNLIGRMIIGAGEIRSSGGAGKAHLKNNNSTYNISQAVNNDNDTAFRLGNVNLHVGATGGYDWCDSLIPVQADPNSNIKLCNSRSNMPPHINLKAFIKVKQDYFKIVY